MLRPTIKSVTIPANQALSGAVDVGGYEFIAFEFPDNFTGTTLTFQAKPNASEDEQYQPEDWDNVYTDAGTELSVTVASNRVVVLTGDKERALSALGWIRVRCGTAAAPTNINPGANISLIVK